MTVMICIVILKDKDEDVGPVRLERFSFRTVLWPSPLEEATLRNEKSLEYLTQKDSKGTSWQQKAFRS